MRLLRAFRRAPRVGPLAAADKVVPRVRAEEARACGLALGAVTVEAVVVVGPDDAGAPVLREHEVPPIPERGAWRERSPQGVLPPREEPLAELPAPAGAEVRGDGARRGPRGVVQVDAHRRRGVRHAPHARGQWADAQLVVVRGGGVVPADLHIGLPGLALGPGAAHAGELAGDEHPGAASALLAERLAGEELDDDSLLGGGLVGLHGEGVRARLENGWDALARLLEGRRGALRGGGGGRGEPEVHPARAVSAGVQLPVHAESPSPAADAAAVAEGAPGHLRVKQPLAAPLARGEARAGEGLVLLARAGGGHAHTAFCGEHEVLAGPQGLHGPGRHEAPADGHALRCVPELPGGQWGKLADHRLARARLRAQHDELRVALVGGPREEVQLVVTGEGRPVGVDGPAPSPRASGAARARGRDPVGLCKRALPPRALAHGEHPRRALLLLADGLHGGAPRCLHAEEARGFG
mmetsp:Transcript_26422/g.88516  ORF Transcript_26422/g.88516 Transcript_26422/m.88516 type:complete len:468 (-) Transcript_26422:55-1458(-)